MVEIQCYERVPTATEEKDELEEGQNRLRPKKHKRGKIHTEDRYGNEKREKKGDQQVFIVFADH